jgi:hypothetical protein
MISCFFDLKSRGELFLILPYKYVHAQSFAPSRSRAMIPGHDLNHGVSSDEEQP